MNKTIETRTLYRQAEVGEIEQEERTINLSFSSEEPVERRFGTEVLDHDPKSIRLGRLRSSGALLVNHNPDDLVGKVESVEIAGRVARAKVRFGKSDRANEIFQDVKDGIRSGISVGYQIHKLTEEGEKDSSIFRATDWEPMEISLVAIAADPTVGIGRSENGEAIETSIQYLERDKKMTEEIKATEAPQIDVEAVKSQTRDAEVKRIQEVTAIGEQFAQGDLARQMVQSGQSVDVMRKAVLENMPQPKPEVQTAIDNLDMEPKEKRSYSMFRAINASASGNWSNAGLEREASDEIAKRLGKEPRGFFTPSDIDWGQRDLTVGSNTAGGFLKGTENMASDFVDALRPQLVLAGLGAKMLSGLQGDVTIPALNAKTSTYWVAESGVPTEGAPTVRQISLSPSTVGCYVDISRKLSKQSDPSAENIFRNDMVSQVASAIDAAGINGSGSSNQPTGILSTSGIGSVAIGTNGGAPTWASVINNISQVAIDNALGGNLAFLTNPQVAGKLRQTAKVGSSDSVMIMGDNNTLAGYQLAQTSNVPSTLTKGSSSVCSALIFGNFNDLIIAQWGGTDVLVDPYTGSGSGTIRVVVFADIDIAVRHAESFSATQDYTTV